MLFNYNFIEIFNAYSRGYFPTLNTSGQFFFYRPEMRPLIPVSGMHVSKTLNQKLKKNLYQVKFNHDFEEVITKCIRENDNWITPELIHVFKYLNKIGYAHSVECYKENKLVGGLYGIAMGAGFFIESMFSLEDDASKYSLYHLILELQKQNFEFIDCQIMSNHLASLGAVNIDTETFDVTLDRSLKITTKWGKDIFQIRELATFALVTDRLNINAVKSDDAERVIALSRNCDMHKYTLIKPVSNVYEFDHYLKLAQTANSKGVPDSLAIRLKENNLYIGSISIFYPIRELPTLEIAIEIDPHFWGKGYGKEAFSKAIHFIFDAFPVYRVQARAVPENISSNQLLRAVGLNFEGTLKQAYWYNDIYDLNYYGITRDAYRSLSTR